ncbi:MAG: phosphoribosylformylglycinamidine synthase I [Thermoplasmata archaeon]|nr:phosphoribosylformylglycinamidine synthase I [Thermoplasmata archaeon]
MVQRGPRVAILVIEGTNCDGELARALSACGARAERVHLKQFEGRDVTAGERRRLDEFAALFVPGGFSAGDYVRAGAILAARIRATMQDDLEAFVRSGRVVAGICNGFQVLTELGMLPGRANGRLGPPEAALMTNDSGHFECRPTFVGWAGGNFPPLRGHPPGERFMFPSAHGEGKLVLTGDPGEAVQALESRGQVLFRWTAPDGSAPQYPWNPNGSFGDIAGLTNPSGTVFGLMPHPERNFFRAQHPEWPRATGTGGLPDGQRFLSAVLEYAQGRVG